MRNGQEREAKRSRDGDALCEAMTREGCPVCLVTLERMTRVMDLWQYEGASDAKSHEMLIRLQGFCPRHTWQLAQLVSLPMAFPLALLYRDILPDILSDMQRRLEQLPVPWLPERESFWHRLWKKQRHVPVYTPAEPSFAACPLCHRQAEIEHNLIHELLNIVAEPEVRAQMSRATGFCLAHFAQAYREARKEIQRTSLLEYQSACLQRNLEELQEMIRKHDYRFLHEPRGDEMTAWRRAMQIFVGNRGIR